MRSKVRGFYGNFKTREFEKLISHVGASKRAPAAEMALLSVLIILV
jgi:hypothetical protein